MTSKAASHDTPTSSACDIRAKEITAVNFAPYGQVSGRRLRVYRGRLRSIRNRTLTRTSAGRCLIPPHQVIAPQNDGKHFDADDAQLVLNQGIPRFYIMRLERRGMAFDNIVHHAKCTQCLGSTQGEAWYIAVSPSDVREPASDNMEAFKIPPGVFIKLNCGTWHAGPLFQDPGKRPKAVSVLPSGRAPHLTEVLALPPKNTHTQTQARGQLLTNCTPHRADHLDFANLEMSDTNVTDFNCHKFPGGFRIVPP